MMQLLFLDSNKQLSKREHELQDAAARSHAATVSHRRARKQTKAKPRSLQNRSTVFKSSSISPIESDASSSVDTASEKSAEHAEENDAVTKGFPPDSKTYGSSSGITPILLSRSTIIKGQSDPFDTLPVRVDRQVHELIMYYRNNILFPRHGVNLQTWRSSQSTVASWRDTRETLEDHGRGYAFLAQVSACLALDTSSGQLAESSLAYIQQSTLALRERLESKGGSQDFPRLWRHIGLLQNAEMLIRNREATVVHGKMLRRLFDRQIAQGRKIDLPFLLHAVYVDVHSAITFLIRPNFEPSAKLVEAFPDISITLLRETSAVTTASMRFLDDQVSGLNLRNIFLKWEQCRIITSFYGRRLWTFMTQLQVVNLLLDVEEKLSRQLDASAITFFHVQAYISLAALYFIRVTTVPEHFVSISLFDAHQNLLRRLRYHLEVSEFIEDEGQYSRARFWALFVGAHSEHQATRLKPSPSMSPSGGWFNIKLAQQAKRCGLRDWTSAKEVLEGFMYCDVLPDPAEWYVALLFWGTMLDTS